MSAENDLAFAYHMGYDDALAKRKPDASRAQVLASDDLADENAKLQELVRDMWRFTGAACKKHPRLFDPAAQGGQAVQLNMIDAF